MLMPKRVKFRRVHRGRMTGKAMRGNTLAYGEYGLVATEPGWITSNQIEAARIAMTRFTKRSGQVWIYKGEVLSQTLRTTPRTMDTSKPYQERRERRPRRDGDRRQGGFNRGDRPAGNFNRGDRPQGQGGFNRGGQGRPQGGFNRNNTRPAAPAAPAKEGGAN